ncbi:phytoene/squalene synthase family protein [Kordiimonas sp.]|uniref:phytoene/squalene synthase family protein n=1 Tax=Kordiimonas sp. TaxID=1970157 RepID=UPI003A94071C
MTCQSRPCELPPQRAGFHLIFKARRAMFPRMQNGQTNTEYCRAMVREDDIERYYSALFAPSQHQADLWALYAFNQEVAKTRESVSEPMIGEIRLQWWREALEGIRAGTPREHPVVQALADIDNIKQISPNLQEVIDGRAQDLYGEGDASFDALKTYAEQTGGALSVAGGLILAPQADQETLKALHASGSAWAMLGIIRALPFQLNDTKEFSVLGELGQSLSGLKSSEMAEKLQPMVNEMTAYVTDQLEASRTAGAVRAVKPVLALNSLSGKHLSALKRASGNPFDMQGHEIGNLGRLFTLLRYHLF